jgi:TonB family protein
MIDALCYLSLGLLVVLICRKPARRAFGAGPAFTIWLLPLLLATLPWLPTVPHAWSAVPTVLVLPTAKMLIKQAAPSTFTVYWAIAIWLIGSALCMIRLAERYRRLIRQTRPLPVDLARALPLDQLAIDLRRLRLHRDGPAVVWAPRSLLLLSPDFLERFDSNERLMVLRHELAHLNSGDTWWSLIAELTLALLWFHPLAWLAMPRFRLDQELACDERVLRQSPMDETAYVNTLLHSTGMPSMPVLIPWLAEPQLKERLTMIQQFRPGALRRQVGFIGLATLMLGVAVAAQAGAANIEQTAKPDTDYNAKHNPVYPAESVKNREQGMVLLDVLVGTDGAVHDVKVDAKTSASPSLIKAATDAVMSWHFNPAIKNGRPVAAYARVPVKFSMPEKSGDASPDAPPPPPPAPPLPPPPPPPPPPAPPHASTSL